jgi:hypothetical protein
MGAFESGSEFLAGVIAKLPAELQAQAKELFGKPEAKDAVIIIGDGAMRQPDYSKNMNDLAAQKAELQGKLDNLTNWYTENKAALEEYVAIKPEYDTLKAKGNGNPPADPAKPNPPADPRKLVEEVVAEQGRDFVQLSAWLASKAIEHFHLFNEPLNVMELTADPRLGKPVVGQPGRVVSLPDIYAAKYGERVAAKAKEAEDKKFNDEVEKRMTAERAKQTGQPFPLRGDASPSVLDVLATKDGPAAHTVDTAVAEYERLSAVRGSST